MTDKQLAEALEHTARHRAASDGIDPDQWRAVLYAWEKRALAEYESARAQPASVAGEWQPSLADVEAWRERNDLEGVLSHSGALTAIDDARSLHLLFPPQPETAQEGENGH
jgi:hypothetical protein